MKRNTEAESRWQHLNRLQKVVLTPETQISRSEYFAQPEKEQIEFYRWMRQQTAFPDLI